ncbi:putative leader peptide [Streptomyces olivaceoviridis]
MTRRGTGTGRTGRTPLRTPLLTSRRHIDLQRVCSAISRHR